ncbi:MAG: hypothetical protein OXI86_01220, partial [Candidatus Poribacteria bacterium]|nr:hypothetical protein [Candidatus Poribacteria bacterium]
MSIERARLIKSCLPVLSILFTLNTSAQDSPQWRLPEGASVRLGKGSLTGPVAYSPDGARLAVASSLGIWFYDTTSFQEIALLDESAVWVENMAFSPDGSTLATVRWNGIYLWDVVTGAHKQTLEGTKYGFLSLAFSPDGGTIASGSYDGTVYLWDVATGEHLHALEGHDWQVPTVAFSRDGKTLASGSSSVV